MLRTLLISLAVPLALGFPLKTSPRPGENEGYGTVDQIIWTARQHDTPRGGDILPGPFSHHDDDDDTILVEMDMKIKKSYYNHLHGKTLVDNWKGLRNETYRWTKNLIPYVIDNYFTKSQTDVIRRGMDEWERYTCLNITPRTNEKNYVQIFSGNGCWSRVGMEGGQQQLSLSGGGCIFHHTVVHELGHTIGFHHEQTRPDRDTYVKINVENIQSGQEYNFEKYNWKLINDFGVTYDYWSVMHYGAYAFSRGGVTIETLNKDFKEIIGSVPGLSFKDIQAANKMYKCDSHCTNTCPKKAIRSKDCKCWCNNLNPQKPVIEWDGVSECKGGDDFTDACIDYHDRCSEWANSGECDANPSYMLRNCRKSCKLCGKDPVCKNYNKNCEYWRVIGECNANPGWMTLHCRKACKACKGGAKEPGPCEDTFDVCTSAAANGDCEKYSQSMLWECPASCRVCGKNPICRNWNILCLTWKEMNRCTTSPEVMNRVCPRACGRCETEDVPDCKNYNKDADCDHWAGMGECARNPGVMLYKCTKSCRVCGDKASCLNYSANCQYWKSAGDCKENKPWMNFNCRLACGLCKRDGRDTETCENHDFNCEKWNGWGECDKNPSFMLNYCPRSCRMCGDDQVCKNFHEKCGEWAGEGECEKNPGYMKLHCRPACGGCTPSDNTTTPGTISSTPSVNTPTPRHITTAGSNTTSTIQYSSSSPTASRPKGCDGELPEICEDDINAKNCPIRAVNGECVSNPTEMYRFCRKSCGMCGPDVKCKDYNPTCENWGNTGQCVSNPGYMYIFCRKSCRCC